VSKILISRSSAFAAAAAFAALSLAVGAHGATVDQVIQDMSIDRTIHAHGGEPNWGCGPENGGWVNNATAPSGYAAMTGWGGIYRDSTDSADTNTRVAIKDFKTYYLSKATGLWTLVQSGDVQGSIALEDWSAFGSNSDVRYESDGAVSVKLPHGYLFHYWPPTRYGIPNTSDVAAFFSTYQARKVLDNSSLSDDRNTAKYVMTGGADWWVGTTGSGNKQIMSSKYRYVTNEWQSITAIAMSTSINCVNSAPVTPLTAANIAAIRANPPPGLTTATVPATGTVPQPPSQITVH
jgi:hypothetical protein